MSGYTKEEAIEFIEEFLGEVKKELREARRAYANAVMGEDPDRKENAMVSGLKLTGEIHGRGIYTNISGEEFVLTKLNGANRLLPIADFKLEIELGLVNKDPD